MARGVLTEPVCSKGAGATGAVGTTVAITRFGLRSGSGGMWPGFAFAALATLDLVERAFAVTALVVFGLAWDFAGVFADVLAASGPETSNGGANDAQNTKSVRAALKRFILVDRSGFSILQDLSGLDPPSPGLRDDARLT